VLDLADNRAELEHAVEDAIRPEGLRAGIVRLPDFSLELEENRPVGAVLLRQFRPISQVHSAVVVLLAPAG